MKVGEIWKMKPEIIEEIRQDFIENDGDDSDFNPNKDPRVRIIEFKDGMVGWVEIDNENWSSHGIRLEEFLEDYEKDYN